MSFCEKPDLENLRKDHENSACLQNSYRLKLLVGTVAMILVLLICISNETKAPKRLEPTPHDYEIAQTLNTLAGREAAIGKKYYTAKIISESIYGEDIISVFEADNMRSFYIFEPLENGYWQKFCGSPFSKTALVKGSAYLGDEYCDIYLDSTGTYDFLLVDRISKKSGEILQRAKISFDASGLAFMELKPKAIDSDISITAYDAEGNEYLLENGSI